MASKKSGGSSPGSELLRWEEWRRFARKRVGDLVGLVERVEEALRSEDCALLAVLHGSILETLEPRDIDVAVYLDPRCSPEKLLDVIGAAEEASGLPADVQLLNDAPPYFTLKALREGVVLVERRPGLATRLYLRALDEREFTRIHMGHETATRHARHSHRQPLRWVQRPRRE